MKKTIFIILLIAAVLCVSSCVKGEEQGSEVSSTTSEDPAAVSSEPETTVAEAADTSETAENTGDTSETAAVTKTEASAAETTETEPAASETEAVISLGSTDKDALTKLLTGNWKYCEVTEGETDSPDPAVSGGMLITLLDSGKFSANRIKAGSSSSEKEYNGEWEIVTVKTNKEDKYILSFNSDPAGGDTPFGVFNICALTVCDGSCMIYLESEDENGDVIMINWAVSSSDET